MAPILWFDSTVLMFENYLVLSTYGASCTVEVISTGEGSILCLVFSVARMATVYKKQVGRRLQSHMMKF
jgi:hypothetical protein